MNKVSVNLILLFILIFGIVSNIVIAQSLNSKVILNENFTGIWEGKTSKLKTRTSTSTVEQEECVFCPQFVVECPPDQILVPQSCNECAHCIDRDNLSKTSISMSINKEKTFDKAANLIKNKPGSSESIRLELCVMDSTLEGVVYQFGVFENEVIKSQSIISKDKVRIVLKNKNNHPVGIFLKLADENHLVATFPENISMEVKKIKPNNACLTSQ